MAVTDFWWVLLGVSAAGLAALNMSKRKHLKTPEGRLETKINQTLDASRAKRVPGSVTTDFPLTPAGVRLYDIGLGVKCLKETSLDTILGELEFKESLYAKRGRVYFTGWHVATDKHNPYLDSYHITQIIYVEIPLGDIEY